MSVRLGWPALLAAEPASRNPSESAGIVFSMFDSSNLMQRGDATGRWRQETRPRAVSLQCLQPEGCSMSFKVSPQFERFDRITLKREISRNVAVWPDRGLRYR